MAHDVTDPAAARREAMEEAADFGWPDALSEKLEAIAEEIIALGVSPSMLGTLYGAMEEAIALYATAIHALATRDTASAPAEPAADRDGGGGE